MKLWIGRVSVVCMLAAAAITGLALRGQSGKAMQAKPPARKVPGVNAPDSQPQACVSCHIHYPEMQLDARFRTLLRQWGEGVPAKILARAQPFVPGGAELEGRHPPIGDALASVPGSCIECHDKSSEASKPAPRFGPMVHALHLMGGDANDFLTVFQGECTHCHKREPATGRWVVPSAPEKK